MIMKTKKLRHLLTATAVLFSMMLALPRQAQAQNTVTIDGVQKNILSTEFLGGLAMPTLSRRISTSRLTRKSM